MDAAMQGLPRRLYWRGGVLWGRVMVKGREHRMSLRTNDVELARQRIEEERERLIDAAYYGRAGLTQKPAEWKPKGPKGFIYFVQAGDSIKIGFAKNWQQRLQSLQTGNSRRLKVLRVIAGDLADEKKIHKRFHGLRQSGEWFMADAELLAWIEAGCPR